MIALMGGIQAGVHKLFNGKPKAVGADTWDRLLERRDVGIKARVRALSAGRAGRAGRAEAAGREHSEALLHTPLVGRAWR